MSYWLPQTFSSVLKGIIPPPCAPWSSKKHLRTTLLTMGLRFVPFWMPRKHSIVLIFVNFFRELLKRKIPTIHLRLLLNMYTNSTACINWNGAFSQSLGIRNGVKQGGILSPVLFCIYIDGLLVRLKQSKIGCWIGNTFVGGISLC